MTNKVARVTFAFWVMKICATTLGETAGDLLSMTLNVGYAVSSLVLLGAFGATLAAQLATRRFHPALYWAVILPTSTAGTTMSDYMDRTLELGYATGSGILATILASNTLGTALGDYLADSSGLGFFGGAALVGSAIALVALAAWRTRIDRVLLFWMAFVLTRPFGATFGDLLTKPTASGGLGFGTVGSSLVLAGILLTLVAGASLHPSPADIVDTSA